jgi:Lar family restriction alleviation protein
MDDKITIDCQTLRPCPFCGEAPEVSDRASNDTATGHVWFIVCMCGGYSAHAHQHGDTQESATTAWNRRAALAAQPAPVAVPTGKLQIEEICRWFDVPPVLAHHSNVTAWGSGVEQDAARYQMLRRGQHWSVINGIGDELRAEALDTAIDAAMIAAARDKP